MSKKKTPEHQARHHSIISPSGAKRWMTCHASPSFEEQFGVEGDQTYANEGTLAHEIADTLLKWELDGKNSFGTYDKFESTLNELINKPEFYDGMLEEVTEYVEYVLEDVQPWTENYLEAALDLSFIAADVKGHNDFAVYDGVTMKLIVSDLKFGLGVRVAAYKNPQLMLYAAGIYNLLKLRGLEVKEIVLQIIQPRMEHLDIHVIPERELLEFLEDVKEAITLVNSKKPKFEAGEHCQFCKAKHRCPELAKRTKEAAEAAKQYFNGELILDAESYEYYLSLQDSIQKFMSAMKTEIYRVLENGGSVPNYKLVEGRAKRYYTDEAAVVEKLEELGLTIEQIYDVELKALTKIEKKLGKKVFKAEIGGFIGVKKGTPTLAHIDDARREISSSAELDFDGIEIID